MNPFDIENIRASLAREHKFSKLRSMYKKSLPEIEDLNTPNFWDKLNVSCRDYDEDVNPMAQDRVRSASGLLHGTNISVLNVGFGSSSLEDLYFRVHERRKNTKWIGIDISAESVNQAKKKYPFGKFNTTRIQDINFKKNQFDYVVALEVFEHIRPSEILNIIKKIKTILKTKGKLIVSVPLNEGLEEMILKNKNPNGHMRIYTADLIKAELIISGFQIVNEQYLYAFNKKYCIKKKLVKYLLTTYRKPNNILILAQKP